ncbi:hypothetical protein PHYPSEUDO_008554 [Phytophthora pseudosyringae]|uniref:Uncharacterized protein n=1 Tax=Phytophthora pseudosyringae TaxID=221518 RepID=A0A8T1VH01_9STRA|nr:hypothetical protein PHYPSEUDO_008554 [Phytophthora pseudosyringae]
MAVVRMRSSLNGYSDWKISSKKKEELEEMEFVTNTSQFKWEAIIMPSLRRFEEEHGHTDVHHSFVVPSGDGTWPTAAWGCKLGCTVERIRHGTAYVPQLEKSEEELERLDFCYKTTLAEREWTEKILPSLEVFRQEFGHCLVSLHF